MTTLELCMYGTLFSLFCSGAVLTYILILRRALEKLKSDVQSLTPPPYTGIRITESYKQALLEKKQPPAPSAPAEVEIPDLSGDPDDYIPTQIIELSPPSTRPPKSRA